VFERGEKMQLTYTCATRTARSARASRRAITVRKFGMTACSPAM
jgi:hypothetical protein